MEKKMNKRNVEITVNKISEKTLRIDTYFEGKKVDSNRKSIKLYNKDIRYIVVQVGILKEYDMLNVRTFLTSEFNANNFNTKNTEFYEHIDLVVFEVNQEKKAVN